MQKLSYHLQAVLTAAMISLLSIQSLLTAAEPGEVTGLSLQEARICVTGFDHNRPDPFPGLGDFIGWVGGVKRLANGELLFVHSAGYWHVSFAMPIVLKEDLVEPYLIHQGFLARTPRGRIVTDRARGHFGSPVPATGSQSRLL